MNRTGQAQILLVMLAIFAFVVGVVLAAPIKDLTDDVRGSDHLDCDSEGLSTGVSATCVIVDMYLPFFIGTLFFGGLALIKLKQVVTRKK